MSVYGVPWGNNDHSTIRNYARICSDQIWFQKAVVLYIGYSLYGCPIKHMSILFSN